MKETKLNSNIQNYNTIIAVLSVPNVNLKKEGFKQSITSTFTTKFFPLESKTILNNMHKHGLKKYIIIHVSEKIDNESSVYSTCRVTKEFDDGRSTTIRLFMFSYKNFFSLETLNFFFETNKHHAFEYVFIFNGMSWHEICHHFISCGLDIGGGSNSKKHVLSPLQLRLSLFLSCLYNKGFGSKVDVFNEVTNSFHREYSVKDKKNSDLSTKEIQDSVISFGQSNEIFKSRILSKPIISVDLDVIESKELVKTNSDDEIPNDNKSKKEEITLSPHQSNVSLPQPAEAERKGVRRYHSYSLVNNSKFNELKDPEILLDQKNGIVPHQQSNLSIFLSDMKTIIVDAKDTNDYATKAAQLKIEELWLSIIKSRLEDEDYLINQCQGKLLSSLHSAKKTIEIYGDNKEFEKNFLV